MVLCEELRYLDTYSYCVSFGPEELAQNWFEAAQKTFPSGKLFQTRIIGTYATLLPIRMSPMWINLTEIPEGSSTRRATRFS